MSYQDRDKTEDSIEIIVKLVVLVLFVGGLGWCGREHREQETRCAAPARSTDYYADPLTHSCGVVVTKQSKYRHEQISEGACEPILARPEFAHVRHCWEKTDSRQHGN
jgi:hypothetical protein